MGIFWECFVVLETAGCSSFTTPYSQPLGTEFAVKVQSADAKTGRVSLRVKESAPPSNNSQCGTPEPLVLGQVTPGRTTGSLTNSRSLPQCDQLMHNSPVVFFNITVPGEIAGEVVITTDLPFSPASFDTVLWLFEGSCDNLTCLATQDEIGRAHV